MAEVKVCTNDQLIGFCAMLEADKDIEVLVAERSDDDTFVTTAVKGKVARTMDESDTVIVVLNDGVRMCLPPKDGQHIAKIRYEGRTMDGKRTKRARENPAAPQPAQVQVQTQHGAQARTIDTFGRQNDLELALKVENRVIQPTPQDDDYIGIMGFLTYWRNKTNAVSAEERIMHPWCILLHADIRQLSDRDFKEQLLHMQSMRNFGMEGERTHMPYDDTAQIDELNATICRLRMLIKEEPEISSNTRPEAVVGLYRLTLSIRTAIDIIYRTVALNRARGLTQRRQETVKKFNVELKKWRQKELTSVSTLVRWADIVKNAGGDPRDPFLSAEVPQSTRGPQDNVSRGRGGRGGPIATPKRGGGPR